MDVDYDDPEELEICPYDPVHRIRRKRFPYHLVKCRKNHVDQKFKACPFNARHVIPILELNYHIRVCPDRNVVEKRLEKVDYTQKGNTEVPSYNLEWSKPVVSESWDDDDCLIQPKSSSDENVSTAAVLSRSHLNGTVHSNGSMEQRLSSLSVGATMQLPTTTYQPSVPQDVAMYSQQPLMNRDALYATAVQQQEMPVAMGRGLGRGRGRGLLGPVRQPKTQPPTMVPVGRGIGALTNNFMGTGVDLSKQMLPQLPNLQPEQFADPVRSSLPDHLKDLSEEELRKRARKLTKMLRQIEKLEEARENGEAIDSDQAAKIGRKADVIEQLEYLKPLNLFTASS